MQTNGEQQGSDPSTRAAPGGAKMDNNNNELSEIQDLFLEDWDGIFEAGEGGRRNSASGTAGEGGGSGEKEEGESGEGGGGEADADNPDAVESSDCKIHRRSSKEIENNSDKGPQLPPPRWHSEAADKPHRQQMILEVARLLQVRKKSHPTKEWLQQLPHKARKLEERLYRNASSLEAYLDRNTLKTRLKKLARTITKQFLDAKRTKRSLRSRSSTSSQGTIGSDGRISFASTCSMASRDSTTESMGSLRRNLRDAVSELNASRATEASAGGETQGDGNAAAAPQADAPSSAVNNMMAMNSIPQPPFSSSSGGDDEMKDASNATPAGAAPAVNDQNAALQQQANAQGGVAQDGLNFVGVGNISQLERQKAVNAQLQQQIMNNIKQQEEMLRRFQTTGQNPQQFSMNGAEGAMRNQMQNMNQLGGVAGQQQGLQQNNRSPSQTPGAGASPSVGAMGGVQNSTMGGQFQSMNQLGQQNFLAAQNALLGNNGGMNAAGMQQGQMGNMAGAPGMANPFASMGNHLMQQSMNQQSMNQQQMNMLRGSGLAGNNHAMMGVMQSGNTILPVSANGQMHMGGLNQSMPPPSMVGVPSMRSQAAMGNPGMRGPGTGQGGAPLSPGSFNW